jgi:hypothetical protein
MSELKIVPFISDEINGDNVVQRLKEALIEAEKGGVSNCIVIMAMSNGSVQDCWANGSKPFVMVGAIESIKREFMDHCIEGR